MDPPFTPNNIKQEHLKNLSHLNAVGDDHMTLVAFQARLLQLDPDSPLQAPPGLLFVLQARACE